jgi:23S rRNA (uracil1939-C5)-methyltransferase
VARSPGKRPTRDTQLVDILRLDAEGEGVADIAGRTVRVPLAIPGERVEVRVAPGRGGFELVRIVSPSPHRVAAPCRHFGPCGGCAWQHIAYPEQLRLKQERLQRLLDESLGARAPEVLPTLGTPPDDEGRSTGLQPRERRTPPTPWHYRNKVSFVFGPGGRRRGREMPVAARPEPSSLVMGHYGRASRTVIPVVECPVHAEAGNVVAFTMRDALDAARVPGASGDAAEGIARHIVVRVAEAGDDWVATLVVTENVKTLRRVTETFVRQIEGSRSRQIAKSKNREIAKSSNSRWGLFLNLHDRPSPYLFGRETRHLEGAREVREEIAGISYLLSPTSFFQTNVRAGRVLVAEVLEALGDRRFARVLDLYAGVGLFALPLARDGRTVTAVEENREAVAAAVAAARENRVQVRRFRAIAARVEDARQRLTGRDAPGAWDAVVLDPPREGCPPVVMEWVLQTLRPARVVYVSCNPEALARDLCAAPPARYAIARVQPIDMFPHTAHVESVAVLDRLTASG